MWDYVMFIINYCFNIFWLCADKYIEDGKIWSKEPVPVQHGASSGDRNILNLFLFV